MARRGQEAQTKESQQTAWRSPFGEIHHEDTTEEKAIKTEIEAGLISPYSGEAKLYPLEANHLKDYDRPTLIRQLDYALEHEDYRPDLDQVKSLVCIYAREYYLDGIDRDEDGQLPDDIDPERLAGANLPWPETRPGTKQEPIPDHLEVEKRIVVESNRWGKLDDTVRGKSMASRSGLYLILQESVGRLSDQDRIGLFEFIIQQRDKLDPYLKDNLDDFGEYGTARVLSLAVEGLPLESKAGLKIGNQILGFLKEGSEKGGVQLPLSDFPETGSSLDQLYAEMLTRSDFSPFIYRALVNSDLSPEETNRFAGMLLTKGYAEGLPNNLNMLRGLADNSKLPEAEKEKYRDLIRDIMNLRADLPAFTSIEALYAAIKFEEYEVSRKTRTPRLAQLKETFARIGLSHESQILDVACGTGWLVNDERKAGFSGAHGVDSSQRNIEVAKETAGEFFTQGNWYDLPFEDESQDAVTCLGRSLPHAENQRNFVRAIRENRRVLKKEGRLIFDMPDPTVGAYAENLHLYREYLKRFGYSDEELADFFYEISSPHRKIFYNRFIPPREMVLGVLAAEGLEVEEVIEEEIPDGKGNRNLVYVCRKAPSPIQELD